MYYPEEIVDEVRERNDIVDVISPYVRLKKSGSRYMGLCPFHSERTPSFSVSPSNQMYYCFGCGAGGNVITFVMEYESMSFAEAMAFLAQRAGIRLPEESRSREERREEDLRGQLLEANKAAAKFYFSQLRSGGGTPAYEYLRGRGLADETIVRFGLGYSPPYGDSLYRHLRELGFGDGLLKESGLVVMDDPKGVHDRFWNRVMYPILDVRGKVIGFGGRVMGDGAPKYLNSPETKVFDKSRNLYGMNEAKAAREDSLILCEGYMDVISLQQAGFRNAVASLGTSLTERQAALMRRNAKEALVCYDSDEAGTRAALRAIPILKEAGMSVKVIDLRPHKDPDEWIKAVGSEGFRERMGEAKNGFSFEIEILERGYDLGDPDQKTAFLRETARRLLSFRDEMERSVYIDAIARKYAVSPEELRRLVNRYGAALPEAPARAAPRQEGQGKAKRAEDGLYGAQRMLLSWLARDGSLFPKIRGFLTADDFAGEPLCHEAAKLAFAQCEEGGMAIPAKIVSHFESGEDQARVAELFSEELDEGMSLREREKALNEIVYRLRRASLEREVAEAADPARLQEAIRAQAELPRMHISL